MEFKYRRLPAIEKKIIDINPSKDIRVRILGNVIDKKAGSLIVDDGSSSAEILSDAKDIDTGDFVRLFVRILRTENGHELHAELVQNMDKLDPMLYQRVKAL